MDHYPTRRDAGALCRPLAPRRLPLSRAPERVVPPGARPPTRERRTGTFTPGRTLWPPGEAGFERPAGPMGFIRPS